MPLSGVLVNIFWVLRVRIPGKRSYMDNMLLWGGLAVALGTLTIGAVYFIIYKVRGAKLDKVLDKEYGKKKSRPGNDSAI